MVLSRSNKSISTTVHVQMATVCLHSIRVYTHCTHSKLKRREQSSSRTHLVNKGEINVDHADLQDVFRAAEALKIRGLVDLANGGAIATAVQQDGVGGGEQRGVRFSVKILEY